MFKMSRRRRHAHAATVFPDWGGAGGGFNDPGELVFGSVVKELPYIIGSVGGQFVRSVGRGGGLIDPGGVY